MESVSQSTNESADFKLVPKRKAAKRKATTDAMDQQGTSAMEVGAPDEDATTVARPAFPPVKREKLASGLEMRKIPVPSHRYSPLKENWMKLFTPIVEHLHLQVRFNLKSRQVEIRSCKDTEDIGIYCFFFQLVKLCSIITDGFVSY